jgi:hypothetical protein
MARLSVQATGTLGAVLDEIDSEGCYIVVAVSGGRLTR